MEQIVTWPAAERADLIREAGALKAMPAEVMEKDFWVCWVLNRLFRSPGMAQTQVKARALADLGLLEDVVAFKDKFYHRGWAQNELAKPGSMRIVPPAHVRKSIEADYSAMEFMFYGKRPTFADMMTQVAELENEINALQRGAVRMPAVRGETVVVPHPPDADIEAIRDILQGYNDPASILKELIQNAEDAGATRMDVVYSAAGDSPFENMPGLLVANDGEFRRRHLEAIPQINLGTKGTDDRAIGRFGKGLKSVFAWCEGFFILARTDPNPPKEDGDVVWGEGEDWIAQYFNPRGVRLDVDFGGLPMTAQAVLNGSYGERPWLALWFPLRTEGDNADGETWIHQQFPGDDAQFAATLKDALRSLAPSLVMLRNLKTVSARDANGEVAWSFDNGTRVPAPDAPANVTDIEGQISIGGQPFWYGGGAGRLSDVHVAALKESRHWPKVLNAPVKGEPHFATLVTAQQPCKKGADGSLTIRWCVFFPVGRQPLAEIARIDLPGLPWDITLNLHGFFFLDSERLRIDGLDEGLPRAVIQQNQNPTCLEWNRIVACEGVLPHVLPAIAKLVAQKGLSPAQCGTVANAVRQTWLWQTFKKQVCCRHAWLPCWRGGLESWELVEGNQAVLIPKVENADEILGALPNLSELSRRLAPCLVQKGAVGLNICEAELLPEEAVLNVLDEVHLAAGAAESAVKWINQLLESLHDRQSLTPQVRGCAEQLPLLSVRKPRNENRTRISAGEWTHRPIFKDGNLLPLLLAAAPRWECWTVVEAELPQWFEPRPPVCDVATAAGIVLNQVHLGDFNARLALVQALLTTVHSNAQVRYAVRHLIHGIHGDGNLAHAGNVPLFIPGNAGADVWTRLIRQLLGNDTWRMLSPEWRPRLTPDQLNDLGIQEANAQSAWEELNAHQEVWAGLEFSENDWPAADISTLLIGIHGAMSGRQQPMLAILRGIPIHRNRANGQRIAITAPDGGLREGVVLDEPGFGQGLAGDAGALWAEFLGEVTVIERLAGGDLARVVQESVFGTAVLSWNYVVRHCIGVPQPARWAQLIMEALATGNAAVAGFGGEFQQAPWLPLINGGPAAPAAVLLIDGVADDALNMLQFEQDSIVGVAALPDHIRNHDGYRTLRNYLTRGEGALRRLAEWLANHPAWHIGLTEETLPQHREAILDAGVHFEDCPGPGARLLRHLHAAMNDGQQITDDMLRRTVWPAVLHPFPPPNNGASRIQPVLDALAGNAQAGNAGARIAFDAYLRQAVADGIIEGILPELSLMNQKGHWLPARELIWPSEGLVRHVQLCEEHARILRPVHAAALRPGPAATVADQPVGEVYNLAEAPDFAAGAQRLRAYFAPFRNGGVGDNLPAALVAVLGGHPCIVELLQELLHDRHAPDEFRLNLLGGAARNLHEPICGSRFLVEVVEGGVMRVQTLTGIWIDVPFAAEINTLLLGEPDDLWWLQRYENRPETACHRLRLRSVPAPEQLPDPVRVFHSTIETILLMAHCGGVPAHLPQGLLDWLVAIADAGQADVRHSQLYLLDMVETRLGELGLRNHPQFRDLVLAFDNARRQRIDAEINGARNAERTQAGLQAAEVVANREREALQSTLSGAAVEHVQVQALVEALRGKMTDYQYDMKSVLLELFQNADDATVELAANGHPDAHPFELRVEDGCWVVIHWGRRINQYDDEAGRQHGFDQDLNKMLSLNFSDKGRAADDNAPQVTGRFGLGFKTVFFVSDEPQVASGRLAFAIRGGFYPVELPADAASELRACVPGVPVRDFPTVIRLPWRQPCPDAELGAARDHFARMAPLLSIFSRHLKTLVVGGQTFACNETQLSAHVCAVHVAEQSYVRLHGLGVTANPASALIRVSPQGIRRIEDGVPRVWITTPTEEPCQAGWALNAPFKPDAGRKRLALGNSENRALAQGIASSLSDSLIELFDLSQNWDALAEGLHLDCTRPDLWRGLWQLVTREEAPLDWDALQSGGHVLSWIMWGRDIGAMRRLVRERAAMPSGLPPPYDSMLKIDDIRYYVKGLLGKNDGENDCFAVVKEWASLQKQFPHNEVVAGATADFLHLVGLLNQNEACAIDLEAVLRHELGDNLNACHAVANRIGALFSRCAWLRDRTHTEEVQRLYEAVLGQVCFMARDKEYHLPQNLVSSLRHEAIIDADEPRRALFAPDSAVLHSDYAGEALIFFAAVRDRLAADAARMAAWARQVTGERLTAVFSYLVDGALDQELADQLGRNWFDGVEAGEEFQALESAAKNEVQRKFARGQPIPNPGIVGPPLQPQRSDPWSAEDLWNWWDAKGRPLDDYVLEGDNNWRLFSPGLAAENQGQRREILRDQLLAADQPAGKALWYRLFGYACLMAAGRRVAEVHRFWTDRLDAVGFWDATATPDAHFGVATQRVFMAAVELEFQNQNAGGEAAHFWRRVFYDVRKVHRLVWEHCFPETVIRLVRGGHGDQLAHFLRSGQIDGQPNWLNVFGQSAGAPLLFIIRELVRLGVIGNEEVRRQSFFVCTPVRRARQWIGWLEGDESAGLTFPQLVELSEKLSAKLNGHEQLRGFHDIPLLHMGLTENGRPERVVRP